MKRLFSLALCLVFTSCTQTMTMVHTQGMADDVVDEKSDVSPNVSPTISPVVNIPASAAALL